MDTRATQTAGRRRAQANRKAHESRKATENLERDVFVLIQRAAVQFLSEVEELLKPVRLSPSQYNVLRILRGAGPKGIACSQIAERMITRDPDMTRLLDRLEKRGLVTRARCSSDRRVIRTHITEVGLALLEQLDRPINELHVRQLQHLGEKKLRTLLALLETARKSGET
jgi:DNA-binding MarR family transcriptional regulator